MNRFLRTASVAFALMVSVLAFAAGPASAALTFPPLTGRVVDNAHILSPQVQAQLTDKLAALEAQTHNQLVVATLASLQGDSIEDYGYQLGRAWGIGQKGQNNGVILIVAPSDHRVRIEVGYGLEPVLTDALTSVIIQTRIVPKFKAGDIPGGVVDGTQAIIDQLALPTDQAQANAQAAQAQVQQQQVRHHANPASGIPALFIILVIFLIISRGGGGGILPWMLLGGMAGRGFGGGGGGFGGGSGGGGFSGGGGSFGGGGSSGSW